MVFPASDRPAAATAAPAPPVRVRPAAEKDMAAVQAIYAHHVLHGLASFEETPPTLDEMARRRRAVIDRGLPYLVADVDGRVAGYAYAAPFRARAAYRNTLEDSVYVAPDMARRGVGRQLLEEVIAACEAQGYRQMIAVIGDSGNAPSIGLHHALGFEMAGNLRSVGYKFGRWVDTVYMQRILGPGDGTDPQHTA